MSQWSLTILLNFGLFALVCEFCSGDLYGSGVTITITWVLPAATPIVLHFVLEDHLLRVTMSESLLALGGGVGASWLSGSSSFLSVFGVLPERGLFNDGVPCEPCAPTVLDRLDQWFYACWCDLPDDPCCAPSESVCCCKYQQLFAVHGGLAVDPTLVLKPWPMDRQPCVCPAHS